jgi:TonB-linked SusC/RagA family outer membrane protein
MKHIKQLISTLILAAVISNFSFAQNRVSETAISGTVFESANGKPLAGASVTLPGVSSAITDEDGKFTLKKSFPGAYITINAPGFATKQMAVSSQKEIKVWLIDDSFKSKYDDVALPLGMKNGISNSAAISTHENRSDYKLGAAGIETVLQTSVNGLNSVSRSGMPGSGANMFINGFNSLNAGSQPLIILDGVMYENQTIFSLINGNNISPLSDIDVKDIENITVLKDGASIYGSKAANGVLIINTLSAKSPATRINFYAYMGANTEPTTQYKMMDAWSYKNYLIDMLSDKGMTTGEIQSLPYINSEKPVAENWGISGNADYYRYNQSTDWQKEVLKTSFNRNYHLNITGGNDQALYAISVGYLGHEGNVDNTSFSRYTTRVNTKIKMTEWFKLNANMSFVYSSRNLSFEGMNRNFNPVYSSLVKSPFTSPYVYNTSGEVTPNLENADVFNVSNPRAIIDNGIATNNRFRFFAVMNGVISLTKYLDADIIVGLTTDKVTSERVFMPSAGVYHSPLPSAVVTNESQQMRNHLLQMNTDARLTYKRTFDYVHNFTTRAGFRFQNSDAELDWGQAYNTSSDEMKTLSDGVNNLAQVGGSLGNWRTISNYLNVDYGYMNKYFISANAALDGSSRFGKNADGIKLFNNVFGLFPSVNAAWLISSEEFMRNQNAFDMLKLRAGYSITGNDNIGNYSARYYYVPQGQLGAYGLVRGNIPNDELKWETNKKAVVGLDASFLKEKLNLSLDVYSSVTENLIGISNIGSYSGIGSSIVNDGSLQNNGIDLSINARIVDKPNLKWDLGVNVSAYKNKLLTRSVDEEFTQIAGGTVRTKTGAPIAQFYGYKTDGILNSDQEAIDANLSIKNPDGMIYPFGAGDVRFVDAVADGIIDDKDMTVIGDPNPDFFGSFNSRLQWKQFTLSAVFTYSVGNDVYNAVRANLESMSGTDNQTIAAAYRWKVDGQNTNMPKATWGDPMGNARFSDRWIEDGSFLRMKNVTLSYNLPIKSSFIANAQAYVSASNMLTLSKYLGYDPEFMTGSSPLYFGIDSGVSPQPKTILFGIKIGL